MTDRIGEIARLDRLVSTGDRVVTGQLSHGVELLVNFSFRQVYHTIYNIAQTRSYELHCITLIPRTALLGKTRSELEALCVERGYEAYRGRQIFGWLYHKRVRSLDAMHNLPEQLKDRLALDGVTIGALAPSRQEVSHDGTKKYLFPTRGGGFIETALIPDGGRLTLCLSTQVGCRRGCVFCQTARQGFQGNLDAGEVVNQLHSLPEIDAVTNIVYMGMGEPLDNLPAVLRSIELFTDHDGYALPLRRITVSTVGVLPQLHALLESSAVNLAVSVHSPFHDQRRSLMPVENTTPLVDTIDLIRRRREDRRRRVSVEYTLFGGVNDTREHARGLARLLAGLSIRVNLIPYHEIAGAGLIPSTREAIDRFRDRLREKDVRAFVRESRGQDINAACGMLWTRDIAVRPDALRGA